MKYGGWTECPECGVDIEVENGEHYVTCPFCMIEVVVPRRNRVVERPEWQ